MKIIHLEASPGWGGQEMRILKESLGMRKRGHEICFAVVKDSPLSRNARKEGFFVYELSFQKKHALKTIAQLLRIFKINDIEIVNTHSSLDAWIGGIAARIQRLKVIRTRHLSTPIRKGLNSRLLYNYLADYVVTTCENITSVIIKQANKNPLCCLSIPTGVNPEEITYDLEEKNSFRKKIGVEEEDFLVGMVCFMRTWKGVYDFIEAARLLKDMPLLKWVIIGGGHEDEYCRKVKDLDLESVFKFTGHIKKPYGAIASLDVFALLSTAHEGVSQASLQAAYLEKPLITTKIGGLPEICIDQETGFHVPTFSPNEVAEKVLELKNQPDLRKTMGKKAKSLVLNHFTYKQMLDQMEKVYSEVLPRF